MSVICDALLIVPYGEKDAIHGINDELRMRDTERHQEFGQLDDRGAGGTKVFVTDVWAGAFNHLLPSVIEDAVLGAEWRTPDDVVFVLHAYDYDIRLTAKTITEWRTHRDGEW